MGENKSAGDCLETALKNPARVDLRYEWCQAGNPPPDHFFESARIVPDPHPAAAGPKPLMGQLLAIKQEAGERILKAGIFYMVFCCTFPYSRWLW